MRRFAALPTGGRRKMSVGLRRVLRACQGSSGSCCSCFFSWEVVCCAAETSGFRRRVAVARQEKSGSEFRQRLLCGLTILYGLRPVGLDYWNGGTLYNPDDGRTYGISAKRPSPDPLVARICVNMPLFGET
jgi:hypothetical protein